MDVQVGKIAHSHLVYRDSKRYDNWVFTQRRRKQTTYALGCLSVLVLACGGIILALGGLPEGSAPTPTPLPSFAPIVVEQVDIIHQAGRVDAVARVRNPNPRAGVANWPVTFIILNEADQVIATRVENAYLLPGSVQFIIALNIEVSDTVHHSRLEIPSAPAFVTLPASLTLPSFNTFLLDRVLRPSGARTLEEQKGIVTNTSTFDFQRVEVRAVAVSSEGKTVGVGTTFLGELKVNEQREFTVVWPQGTASTARVFVVPVTNIFAEENIIRVIGDPALLR